MEANLPNVESEDATEGSLLHALMAGQKHNPVVKLDDEQQSTLELCRAMEDEYLAYVEREQNLAADEAREHYRELELPFVLEGADLFFSHVDSLWIWPKKKVGLLVDYKFGRGVVPSAEANLQIRCYCLVAAEHYGLELIYGAVLQPRVSRKVASTVYGHGDLSAARREIEKAWVECNKPNAPRNPSLDACTYCRGLSSLVCEEAREESLHPVYLAPLSQSPELLLARMAPDVRARLLEAFALCRKLDATFTKAAKDMVAKDPDFIPGWKLVPGGERETVTDPLELYLRLNKRLGVQANDFIDIVTVPKKKLSDLVRDKAELKGKALANKMEELLNGVVDVTPIAPSLERTT